LKYYFLTLFPAVIRAYFEESMMKRAVEAGLIEVDIRDIRDYTKDRHRRTDDYPYGGGAGLVMTPQPAADAIRSIPDWQNCQIIHLSPGGEPFTQKAGQELAAGGKDMIFLCGHYEGIDQRVLDRFVNREFSAGDYVLTGGELPALMIADATARNIPGVLGNSGSLDEESFSDGLLEYPQYTRPEVFEGDSVPEVLLSGHHKHIEEWRLEQAEKRTREQRPDLWKRYSSKSK
jgi:tRNA (guanine37-N1)-methyltransferase